MARWWVLVTVGAGCGGLCAACDLVSAPPRSPLGRIPPTSPSQLPSKVHRPGDLFGASGVLADDGCRSDTAMALEATSLRAIPFARFQTMLRHDSLLAEGIRRASSASFKGPEHYEDLKTAAAGAADARGGA